MAVQLADRFGRRFRDHSARTFNCSRCSPVLESCGDPAEADAPAIESCSLVTGEPNELQARLYDRMPIILDSASYNVWLDPANEDRERLQAMQDSAMDRRRR